MLSPAIRRSEAALCQFRDRGDDVRDSPGSRRHGAQDIVKFEGCYHGHADGLLVKAGSGVATFGIPGSAGVPEEIASLTLALPYNDLAAVEAAFAAHPGAIAAVILEPVVGNAGCIAPAPATWPDCARSLSAKARC